MAADTDIFSDPTLLEGLTIRAGAACYVTVAESVLAAAPPDDGSLILAREALDLVGNGSREHGIRLMTSRGAGLTKILDWQPFQVTPLE